MTDCPHTTKGSAVEMLAKYRAARADRPNEAFKKVEPAKKGGRILFKAKNTSFANMTRVERNGYGSTLYTCMFMGNSTIVLELPVSCRVAN
jgi:hypothetical protein